ncbi:Mur ligase family protein [Facklamia miroungae]|uniref:Lipid II isoglutaminyl synthase (glutamine-hydrolyzing) subunit MurT n=1 Tax=Facklamia miroungae TaxID=120956 RepID=A0A1G7TS43_9LACT|nr:Mur ligase family protein [Facklamia miroungae]NKZ29948.1 Mur ligase family protein [Facklamia miroungae]SDG38088.1 UDP-N-acetylmuramoyl-L-alanyl-D-glutamate--2,6-diaminopimelate ligase [Facklamia miroungae]
MPLRNQIARIIGKTSRYLLTKYTHGGSSLPGKLALSIDPNILENLSKNYQVIVVTGTNGKTLTTSLIVEILKEAFPFVLTNPTGSNMQQGIITTFLDAPLLKEDQKGMAVLEVDEGSLSHVVKALKPDYFVFTNIFRDQLDRFGELHTIFQLLKNAAESAPSAKIIANGDLPMFNSSEIKNQKIFFGFNHQKDEPVTPNHNTDGLLCPECDHILSYNMLTYANLGNYYCQNCGFRRPELSYQVDQINELTLSHSQFTINSERFDLPVAGKYNIYNALAAYSVAKELGLDTGTIRQGFENAKKVFGRQESIQIKNKKVLLNLVKNPVGLDQVLELIAYDQHPFTLVNILNNQYADGTDVSWIWDGNYECLNTMPVKEVITAGDKIDDMTKRLIVAGLDQTLIKKADSTEQLIHLIENAKTENIHILATYTAMLKLREELKKLGYIGQ